MNNPLASALGFQSGGVPAQPQMSPQMANLTEFINRFNQFRQTFSGDPRQMGQSLLRSGKISQEMFSQLSPIATQLQNMLGIR